MSGWAGGQVSTAFVIAQLAVPECPGKGVKSAEHAARDQSATRPAASLHHHQLQFIATGGKSANERSVTATIISECFQNSCRLVRANLARGTVAHNDVGGCNAELRV